MPVIERANIRYENKVKGFIEAKRFFNLSKPVGRGQVNEFGDVYLVQALFAWILRDGGVFKGGAFHSGIVPTAVTGAFNQQTQQMISLFQQGGRWKIEKTMRADGIIHPASFENRALRFNRTQMSIVKLNMDAAWGVGPAYEYDHVRALVEKYPLLMRVTMDKTGGGAASEFVVGWKN